MMMYGSRASSFLLLMRSPKRCSRAVTMSVAFMLSHSGRCGRRNDESSLGGRRQLLLAFHVFVGLFRRVQLVGEQDVAGACWNGQGVRSILGVVLHALDLVLNAHEAFEQSLRPRRAAG